MLYDALDVYRDMLHDEESTPEGSPGLSPLEELDARCPCCFGPRKEGDLAKIRSTISCPLVALYTAYLAVPKKVKRNVSILVPNYCNYP